MPQKSQSLVSIIIPVFNAEKFLIETVASIQNQTYKNWELILVNDGSDDDSLKIAQDLAAKDIRIKVISIKNSGAAIARNTGIKLAKGNYLCFIDADDLWLPKKLEKQLAFMQTKNCAFSFTGYEFADETGRPNGKKVHVPTTITYRQALKNTTISTITVMFDMCKFSKNDIEMPNVKSEDTATWWKILKKINLAYGLDEVLSYYRRTSGSSSANKITAVKHTWNLYRKVEQFNITKSIYYFLYYALNATRRRL